MNFARALRPAKTARYFPCVLTLRLGCQFFWPLGKNGFCGSLERVNDSAVLQVDPDSPSYLVNITERFDLIPLFAGVVCHRETIVITGFG